MCKIMVIESISSHIKRIIINSLSSVLKFVMVASQGQIYEEEG